MQRERLLAGVALATVLVFPLGRVGNRQGSIEHAEDLSVAWWDVVASAGNLWHVGG
jgi:hypothetical protein